MNSEACLCCGEKVDKRRDRPLFPYCSVVCRTLGRAGLGWRLYPYRIVDLQSGTVLTTGLGFDLTANGLAELQKKAERLRESRPDPAALKSSESITSHVPEHSRPLEPAFTGTSL